MDSGDGMKLWKAIPLAWMLVPAGAGAKDKKPQVAAVLGTATYTYVESPDGDAFRPGLYPEDRRAIGDVENALRDWNRYRLTTRRNEAEIVIVVRKGRLANGRIGAQVPIGQPTPPNQPPTQPGRGPGIGAGGPGVDTGVEAGSDEDMLRVYMLNPDGKLVGPIWNRTMTDGLDEPGLLLFRQLKDAVEKAYPQPAAAQPAKP